MLMLLIGAAALLLTPAIALAQSPPPTPNTPVAPKSEQLDPNACAHPGGLTDFLYQREGEIIAFARPDLVL